MATLYDLQLKEEDFTSTISLNGVEIKVKSYVSLEQKASLINLAIQEGKDEKGLIQRLVSDSFFAFFTVVLYSDIEFTDREKSDYVSTYDTLEKHGIIDRIIQEIPTAEYDALVEGYESAIKVHEDYRNSLAGAAERFLGEMPQLINGMDEALASFDPSKLESLQEVLSNLGGSEPALSNAILGQK